jgi:hypothetical protein
MDFALSLKHKRQEFSVAELIGSLNVEERTRAKDTREKGIESSSANMLQKKNSNASHNNNKKKRQENNSKPKQTTIFKKKKNIKDGDHFVCGSDEHWTSSCPDLKFKQEKKFVNMVVSEAEGGTSRYGYSFPTVLSIYHSPEWWMDTGPNIHTCADASLFSSYQVGRTGALQMGNMSHACVLSVGTVILKFTSKKTVLLKNVQYVPSIKKNLVSGSQCCQDGYKIVFESNKYALSKYGTLVGKGYDCGGLFHLSLHDDMYNNIVNNAIIPDELNIWHSRLCHVNFGCLSRLANMNLIPKINLVKGSKCHVCVQSKQSGKPHKVTEARNLAPLELVHSDLC